jgi:hypothetical protein
VFTPGEIKHVCAILKIIMLGNIMKRSADRTMGNNPIDETRFLESVAKRAYFYYVNSASTHGNDLEHWLKAEQQTLAESRRRKL